jgi:hypothetical protein|tara:strand:+ start:665 stop:952 length:288 start_codon:yes stop_codon:yes gene_type:complete
MPESADEAKKITEVASAPIAEANEQARQAWRGWVIPAVGSMAFFSSMVINGMRNYKSYGFPYQVFTRSDWVLLAMPPIIIVAALSDIMLNGENYD